jgi:hypothetical protein
VFVVSSCVSQPKLWVVAPLRFRRGQALRTFLLCALHVPSEMMSSHPRLFCERRQTTQSEGQAHTRRRRGGAEQQWKERREGGGRGASLSSAQACKLSALPPLTPAPAILSSPALTRLPSPFESAHIRTSNMMRPARASLACLLLALLLLLSPPPSSRPALPAPRMRTAEELRTAYASNHSSADVRWE